MSGAMDQLYQQVILDHARERSGEGELGLYDGESFQVNPTCGDEVRLRVRLDEGMSGPRIGELGWVGRGCSISQASLSVLHELVAGESLERAEALGVAFRTLMQSRGGPVEPAVEEVLEDAAAFAGVARYPARIKCALLGWMALRDASAQALSARA